MKHKFFQMLLLTFIFCNGNANEDISQVSDIIKKSIFSIYTGATNLICDAVSTPVSVLPDLIRFVLYTKEHPDTPVLIDPYNPIQLNTHRPIVFLIHGWVQDVNSTMHQTLKSAFFARNDQYLVVSVDWYQYAKKEYFATVSASRDVGSILGKFLAFLHQNYHIEPSSILLVGFSLGAHIAGWAGKLFKELTSKILSRIVALDAAGPCLHHRSASERLDSTDAEVVEVIHVSGGTFGYLEAIGTIDFFPNGGVWQTGCPRLVFNNPAELTLYNIVFCHHIRSWKYFAEAVANPRSFLARQCSNYLDYKTLQLTCGPYERMGNLDTVKTGKFYFDTNTAPPYSK